MIKGDFKIDRRFTKRLQAHFGRYQAQVGILNDRPHFEAIGGRKASLAGGPARRKGVVARGMVSDVGESIRKVHGVPYLTAPFRRNTKERRAFVRELGRLLTGKAQSYARIETTLRRLIREPILLKRYGRNTLRRARVKGFNRFLIDTGQFFRAITAKVRRRVPK